jgi:hypothetical protein
MVEILNTWLLLAGAAVVSVAALGLELAVARVVC